MGLLLNDFTIPIKCNNDKKIKLLNLKDKI